MRGKGEVYPCDMAYIIMKKARSEQYYLVENLTLFTYFFYFLPLAFRGSIRTAGGRWDCCFIEGSPIGIGCGKILAYMFRGNCTRLDFDCHYVESPSGTLSIMDLIYSGLTEFQDEVLREMEIQGVNAFEDAHGCLSLYIKKNVVAGTNLEPESCSRSLFLIQLCRWHWAEFAEDTTKELIVLLNRRVWQSAVCSVGKTLRVKVVTVWWGSVEAGRLWGICKNIFLQKGLWGVTKQILKMLRPQSAQSKPNILLGKPGAVSDKNANLAVLSYIHFNLQDAKSYSDLHFWQESSLDADRIVVLFCVVRDPLDEEKMALLKHYGMRGVGLSHEAVVVEDVDVLPPPAKGLVSFARESLLNVFGVKLERRWVENVRNEFGELRDYWADVFTRHNVRVYTGWYKNDASHLPISQALKDTGGIMTMYQRSVETLPSAITAAAVDAMFVFGRISKNVEQLSDSVMPFCIITGYLGDHRFSMFQEDASAIRNSLRENGAEYVVTYLDENSVDDARWWKGHDLMRGDYSFLLEKLLQDDKMGLIFKPKAPGTLARRLGEVRVLWDEAMKTGRCISLGGDRFYSNVPPALAAMASDVVIHQQLAAATAALESALCGVPTLLLDREKLFNSPLYELGKGKVIFDDMKSLWPICKEHRKYGRKIANFGDWSPVIDDLDPFRDGKASQRMGIYLQWLLDGFAQGENRGEELESAAESYRKKWGDDKDFSI
jgi:hypothetical protein